MVAQTDAGSSGCTELIVTTVTMIAVMFILLLRALTTGLLSDELLFVHAIDLGFIKGLCAPGSSHPPLMRLIVGACADGASADWLLRMPSILFSVATVPVWSRVLKHVFTDSKTRHLLLITMALNPIWLGLGFQCLPYATLTFFASLHCLAWLAISEGPSAKDYVVLAVTGIALPWTHFLGVNVLLVDVLIWLAMVRTRRVRLYTAIKMNAVIASCTLAVVPIALFYIRNDSPYPLVEIGDFATYFQQTSSLIFSHVTFSSFMTTVPLQFLFYVGSGVFLWQAFRQRNTDSNTVVGIVLVGMMMTGFAAAQVRSLLTESAMWPRYLLTGAWVHLPLIIFLTQRWLGCKPAKGFAYVLLALATLGCAKSSTTTGSDYAVVGDHLNANWQPADAFLAQSMDLWSNENHFDQLWFRRYVSKTSAIVTGPQTVRRRLYREGLPISNLDQSVQRVWVYSHLFRADWLQENIPAGWKLQALYEPNGPFPLALLVRDRLPTAVDVALR